MSPDDLPQLLEIERNRTAQLTQLAVETAAEVASYKKQVGMALTGIDEVTEQLVDVLAKLTAASKEREHFKRMWLQQRDYSLWQGKKFYADLRGMGKGLATKERKIKELYKQLASMSTKLDTSRTINAEIQAKLDQLSLSILEPCAI